MASDDTEDDMFVPTNQPLLPKPKEVDSDVEENQMNETPLNTTSCQTTKNEKSAVASVLSANGSSKLPNTTYFPACSETTMAKSQSETQVCVASSLPVNQMSKASLMTFSSSGTFYDHTVTKGKTKMDFRITPKRVPRSNGKVRTIPPKLQVPLNSRRCQQQSFHADTTDFRQMEQGLLQLLDDFHSGKLDAFGKDCTFEKMENVREQQEKLARLHFDLNAQQEMRGQRTEEGLRMAKEHLAKLMENLQQLSLSIEQLQSATPGVQTGI